MQTISDKLTLKEKEMLQKRFTEIYLQGANDILDGLIKIFESESRDFTQSEIIESIHILKTTVNS